MQRIANLPVRVFQRYIDDTVGQDREPTTAGLLKLAKGQTLDGHAAPNVGSVSQPPLGGDQSAVVNDLRELIAAGKQFGTIYADPPWPYGNQATRASTDNHYATMSVESICNEPVKQLVSAQGHLHLWTTNAFLWDALDVMEAWGFEYKSCFVWVKPQLGIGNYWRVSHEFLLLGVRGGLTFADRSQRSWFEHPRGRHSQKPEAVREMIQRVSSPDYLELYGRKRVAGWTVYGNEVR